MRASLIWLFLIAPIDALANNAAPCQVRVILFVPSDVAPPKGYQQRIDQIVNYTEAFLDRGCRRWGHENIVMPFRRAADRRVEVTMIRGKELASFYKPISVRAEVMDTMRGQGQLVGGRQIWWIMVYAGDPPARFAGFLGGFGAWSIWMSMPLMLAM